MIKVYITDHHFGGRIRLFVVDKHGRVDRLLRYEAGVLRWDTVPEDGEAASNDPVLPTLELPEDSGRALLEALTRYYNGAEDTRALRRDYDAERKRLDTAVEVIADIARSLAVRSTH